MSPTLSTLVGRINGRRQPNPTLTVVDIPPEIGQFAQQKNMNICQLNIQRMFGPSFDVDQSWMPEHGSEVFVGRLPRDLFEPELVPFLEKAGQIYQIRLMMDFSGTNKGYCFVKYFDAEHAQLAVDMLNEKQVRPGHPVVVNKSVDNKRLLLSGVPTSKTQEEVEQAIREISGGVVNVELTWDMDNPGTSTGVVFVTYICHHAAAIARKFMLPPLSLRLWDKKITAEWAHPVIEPPKRSGGSKVLLVQEFNPGTNWRLLREYLNIVSVAGVRFIQMSRRGTVAHVIFQTWMHAEAAMAVLDGAIFYGCQLQADWWTPEKVPEGRKRNNRPRCLLPVGADQGEPSPSGGIDDIGNQNDQQLAIEIPEVEPQQVEILEVEIPEVEIPEVEIPEVEPPVPADVFPSPYFQPFFAHPNYEYMPVYMPLPLPQDGYFGIAAYPEQSPAFWSIPVAEAEGYQYQPVVYVGYPAAIVGGWNDGGIGGVFDEQDGIWAMDRNSGFPME